MSDNLSERRPANPNESLLDDNEELAVQVKAILDKYSDPKNRQALVNALVELIQRSVEEAIIFSVPATPLRRLGKSALVENIRSIEEQVTKTSDD